MGKNSHFENLGKERQASEAEVKQLAFADLENSPIFRSLAATEDPRVKNFQIAPIVKRGRPRGVKNRDNVKLAQLINARLGVDPYLAIADFCKLPLKQASAVLQCTVFEAFKLQMVYLEKLGERIHGKSAQEIKAKIENQYGAAIFNIYEFENEADAIAGYRDALGFQQGVEFVDNFSGETLEVTASEVTDRGEGQASD